MNLPIVTSRVNVHLAAVEPFDYANVAPDLASNLQARAERIRGRTKSITAAILEIGRDLIAVKRKKILDHGLFGKWVEAECGFTLRSAENYIRAAEFAEGKNETISLLAPTTVYKLAARSAPPEVVEAVVAKAAAGEILPKKAVEELFSSARDQRKEVKREADRKARDARRAKRRTKAAREQAAREQEEDERRRQREREEIANAAATLIRELGADGAALVHKLLTGADVFAYAVLTELKRQLGNGGAA
jgi:hypothetical protein